MKFQKDCIQASIRINKFHLCLALFLFLGFSACVFEESDLRLNIVNLSDQKIYVGGLYTTCDTCKINLDVKFFCSNKDANQDLRIIAPGDSIQLRDKLLPGVVKLYSLNADSLNQYCNKNFNYSIADKSWVKKFSGRIDREKKVCTIKIN